MDATAALDEARAAGYKVRITHLRWAHDVNSGRMALIEARIARLLELEVDEKGGSTLVELLAPDGRKALGQSLCLATDNFHRSLGTIIALGRARKRMESEEPVEREYELVLP